jgi:hypothetical protein
MTLWAIADDATSRHVKADAFVVGCSRSTVKPTGRSLLYVTELLHRVQYTKAISFASMIRHDPPNPEAKAGSPGAKDHAGAAPLIP